MILVHCRSQIGIFVFICLIAENARSDVAKEIGNILVYIYWQLEPYCTSLGKLFWIHFPELFILILNKSRKKYIKLWVIGIIKMIKMCNRKGKKDSTIYRNHGLRYMYGHRIY